MRADVLPVRGLDERVVDAWRGLVAHAVEPNAFHQPECVLPAVRCLTAGNDVELLVVWSGAELVFVLPVERIRRYRRLPMPAWSWWRHPYAYLSTPLLASGVDGQAVWEAVLSHLAGQGSEWMLALDLFPLDGPVSDALHIAATGHHGLAQLESFERAMVFRRPEPTYLDDRISARHRKSLRRYHRRLEEELGGDVVVVDRAGDDDDGFRRAVDGFLSQEAAGWKGHDGGAFACRPQHAEFFRDVVAGFRAAGQTELWALGAGDAVAAYQCNLRAADTVFHWKVSYDESLARWSPGMQLELAMVDEFHRDTQLRCIDSCTDPGTNVSEQLYPDRRGIGFLVVPLRGGLRGSAVAATPTLARTYRRVRSGRHG